MRLLHRHVFLPARKTRLPALDNSVWDDCGLRGDVAERRARKARQVSYMTKAEFRKLERFYREEFRQKMDALHLLWHTQHGRSGRGTVCAMYPTQCPQIVKVQS